MKAPTFREGDRVAFDPDLIDMVRAGRPEKGELGTVALVRDARGNLSVYPDPVRSMVYVKWDRAGGFGVARWSAVKVG